MTACEAGGQRRHQVLAVAVDGADRHRRQQFYPVPSGLGDEPLRQLGPGNAIGEAGIVVDAVADACLPAKGAGFHHDGVDALPGGIDPGGQAGRATPGDDQVIGGSLCLKTEAETARQRLVAGVHVVVVVVIHHRWYDLAAALKLLEALDGLRVLIDIDVGVGDPVSGQKPFYAFAMWAPGGAVDGETWARGSHHATPTM
jgi:hypothetical protein